MEVLFIKRLRIIMIIALTILISFHFLRISLLDTIETEIIQGVKPELSIDSNISIDRSVLNSTSRKLVFLRNQNSEEKIRLGYSSIIEENLPVAIPPGFGKDRRGNVYYYKYLKKTIYTSEAEIVTSTDYGWSIMIEIELSRNWLEIFCWIVIIVGLWMHSRIIKEEPGPDEW